MFWKNRLGTKCLNNRIHVFVNSLGHADDDDGTIVLVMNVIGQLRRLDVCVVTTEGVQNVDLVLN